MSITQGIGNALSVGLQLDRMDLIRQQEMAARASERRKVVGQNLETALEQISNSITPFVQMGAVDQAQLAADRGIQAIEELAQTLDLVDPSGEEGGMIRQIGQLSIQGALEGPTAQQVATAEGASKLASAQASLERDLTDAERTRLIGVEAPSPDTVVNVQNITETEMAKQAAEFVNTVETEVVPNLAGQERNIDQLNQLFDEGLTTGRAQEIISSLSNTLGVTLSENTPKLEAMRALANQVIIGKIGEATFGSLSEGERQFLANTTASPAITTESNRARLKLAKKMVDYDKKAQVERARYAAANKTTAGLSEHMALWASANPLVTAEEQQGLARQLLTTSPTTGEDVSPSRIKIDTEGNIVE